MTRALRLEALEFSASNTSQDANLDALLMNHDRGFVAEIAEMVQEGGDKES